MQSPTVTVRPAVQGSKELGVFEREGVQTLVITVHCPLDRRVGKTVPPSVPSGLGLAVWPSCRKRSLASAVFMKTSLF